MTIHEDMNGEVLTVKPEGRLDALSAQELDEYLANRYDGVQQVILDLSEVSYISSAGLRTVMQACKSMKEKGGLLLCNVSEPVMEVLRLTGYVDVLKIIETPDAVPPADQETE